MSKKFKRLAQDILNEVGGADNVNNLTHCMTRLRFNLKNKEIVNKENIKSLSGVIGVVENDEQYQIIIGNDVSNLYSEIDNLLKRFFA